MQKIKTVFEYWVNDNQMILVQATAKDVDSLSAQGLKLHLPHDFKPTRDVADDIEEKAIEKLYEKKFESELDFE